MLIALSLVSLCGVPLINSHFAIAKQEITSLKQLQLEKRAREIFFNTQEKLYTQEISYESLTAGKKKPRDHVGKSEPFSLKLPNGQEIAYVGYSVVHVGEQYEKAKRAHYRLLEITVVFHPVESPNSKTRFSYQLFAERLVVGASQPWL